MGFMSYDRRYKQANRQQRLLLYIVRYKHNILPRCNEVDQLPSLKIVKNKSVKSHNFAVIFTFIRQ